MKPCLLLLCLLSTMIGQAATPKFIDATAADNFKVYWLVKTAEAPTIDGQLDEPIWTRAQPLSDWGVTNYGRQRANLGKDFVPGKIDLRAAWDDTYLYLAARCYHQLHPNDMKELVRNVSNRAAAIYARECVEIHIDGNLDHATRFQAIINPLNEKMMIWHYDFGWGILENSDYGLDADWDVAAKLHDDHWAFEMRIALADIQVTPKVGAMFGINPCWFDWADSRAGDGTNYWWQFVTWSTHDDSHHDPRLYGRFILVDDEPKSLEAGLRLAYPDLEKRTLMIQTPDGYLVFAGGKASQVGFDVQVREEAKAVRTLCNQVKAILANEPVPNSGHYAKTVVPEQEAALAAIEKELSAEAVPPRGRIAAMRRELGELRGRLDDAYWVVKQDALLSSLNPQVKE